MEKPPGHDAATAPQNRAFDRVRLAELVDMGTPEAVHVEVLHIVGLINPRFDIEPLQRLFRHIVDLYEGRLDEYRACNTDYHDLRHITDTYLAMARLLHGTQDHVQLSMDFVERHADTLGLESQEVKDIRDLILCTDLLADIPSIEFSSPEIELLGKMVATADLLAQMADRTYLEKLLFLYHEFREAEIGDFKNEVDFLQQTVDFYKVSEKRFKLTLENICSYMGPHFQARWDINENLYIISMENQRRFLEKIVTEKTRSVYDEFKRENIVQKAREKFGRPRRGK